MALRSIQATCIL